MVVVLPERPRRLVTRELLYTGITRARTKVTVIGPRDVIAAAMVSWVSTRSRLLAHEDLHE